MIKIRDNARLKGMNTFGIEAVCRRLVEFDSGDDLPGVFADVIKPGEKWSVISGGSNIVFTGDYEGTLLHPTGDAIAITSDDGDTVEVHVEGGVEWNAFVDFCVDNGLWGAENLAYIPGYVGACPVQNIGAYGVEAKDIISSVEMFCVPEMKFLTLAAAHCGFGYRSSIFKGVLRGKVVITAVNFTLSRKESPNMGYGDLRETVESMGGPSLGNIRDAVTAIRKSKLPEPEELGNAGSFFKNPVVPGEKAAQLKKDNPSMPLYPSGIDGYAKLAAGWLIDQCGWKGKRIGNVGVHERQALVIVNYGGADGEEVMNLSSLVRKSVSDRFGIELETEVNVL